MNAEIQSPVVLPHLSSIKNGTFTVRSVRTGEHRTFRIKVDPDKGVSWVSLLVGPDNTEDYVSFARIIDGHVCVFYKHTGTQYHKLAEMLNKLGRLVESGAAEVFHAGTCLVCGRELTTPESVLSGIGPVCSSKI